MSLHQTAHKWSVGTGRVTDSTGQSVCPVYCGLSVETISCRLGWLVGWLGGSKEDFFRWWWRSPNGKGSFGVDMRKPLEFVMQPLNKFRLDFLFENPTTSSDIMS